MSKPSWVFVIVEDDHHKILVYRYLLKCGLGSHEFRIVTSPSGRGSAEGWVRTKFVEFTNAYRTRRTRAETALIVVIDADTGTVQNRLRQLDQALRDAGKNIVQTSDRIARMIPKRNVETWVLCLNEHEVDEETDYKMRDDWTRRIRQAAETLAHWTSPGVDPPQHCVDSLRLGVRELKQLALGDR